MAFDWHRGGHVVVEYRGTNGGSMKVDQKQREWKRLISSGVVGEGNK